MIEPTTTPDNTEKNKPSATELGLSGAATLAGVAGSGYLQGKDLVSSIIGTANFTHGTSDAAAAKILRNGIDPAKGGQRGGATILGGHEREMRDALAGNVYVASAPYLERRRIAGTYAHVVSTNTPEEARRRLMLMGINPYTEAEIASNFGFNNKGTVLHGVMDYNDFSKKFETDPTFRAHEAIEANGLIDRIMNPSFRTKDKLGPELFSKEVPTFKKIWEARAKDFPKYVKDHPWRFGGGLAGASLLTLGAVRGVNKLREALAAREQAKEKEPTKLAFEFGAKLAASSISY